jgi:hypothetical protein
MRRLPWDLRFDQCTTSLTNDGRRIHTNFFHRDADEFVGAEIRVHVDPLTTGPEPATLGLLGVVEAPGKAEDQEPAEVQEVQDQGARPVGEQEERCDGVEVMLRVAGGRGPGVF